MGKSLDGHSGEENDADGLAAERATLCHKPCQYQHANGWAIERVVA
jgi:hypothetical protein